jgi:hypothetical protein
MQLIDAHATSRMSSRSTDAAEPTETKKASSVVAVDVAPTRDRAAMRNDDEQRNAPTQSATASSSMAAKFAPSREPVSATADIAIEIESAISIADQRVKEVEKWLHALEGTFCRLPPAMMSPKQ